MKKNLSHHENNSERGTIICYKQEPIALQDTYYIYQKESLDETKSCRVRRVIASFLFYKYHPSKLQRSLFEM